jgi:hypothetical protein
MKTAGALLMTVLLTACAMLDQQLSRNLGHPVANAIEANGAPTQTADLPDGRRAYTWIQRRGGMECWITLTADREGMVRRYSHHGCE